MIRNTMKKAHAPPGVRWLAVVGSLMLLAASSAQAQYSTGSRWATYDTQITATDPWGPPPPDFGITWTVTAPSDETNGLWMYNYTVTSPGKGLSHIIFELSADTGVYLGSDKSQFVDGEPFAPEDTGNDNPNLPGSIYGVKFAGSGELNSYTFYSDRAPMWGDFYAKDGVYGTTHTDVTAWNADFGGTPVDTYDGANDGTSHVVQGTEGLFPGYIPVPNFEEWDPPTRVPEPGSLALLLPGLLPLGLTLRRRSSHS